MWSTPVSLVEEGGTRWLVAPVAGRSWVLNTRAAGWVELRRGRRRERRAVVELSHEEAVPVLRRYVESRAGRLTQPFFDARPDSPDEAWLAEADRHAVFRLEERI